MVQNFTFGSAEKGAYTLALLIGLGFLIMGIPYASTAIDDANIDIFTDEAFDVTLPHKQDWGANGTFVENTFNVTGTLQVENTTGNGGIPSTGIYLTDGFSGEQALPIELERMTYETTVPGNSEVIAQVGTSNDDFTSYEERENYTLEPTNNEVALDDFNTTASYVNAKLFLTVSTSDNSPLIDSLGFEGNTIRKTDESVATAIENLVFFIIIVFALAYGAWLIVSM